MFAARSTGFSLCLFVLGFVAPAATGVSLSVEQAGTLAAISAGLSLFFPRYQVLASLAGGIVTGGLGPLIGALGAPTWLAIAFAATIPAITLWLRRNPNFAAHVIQDEALLLLFLLGLGAAVLPPMLEGWQTARGMSGPVGASSDPLPAWVLLTSGASLLLGSGWAVWKSR